MTNYCDIKHFPFDVGVVVVVERELTIDVVVVE